MEIGYFISVLVSYGLYEKFTNRFYKRLELQEENIPKWKKTIQNIYNDLTLILKEHNIIEENIVNSNQQINYDEESHTFSRR